MADMRTLATGLECYAVENDAYPPWDWQIPGMDWSDVYRRITTPIACLTSALTDPFIPDSMPSSAVWDNQGKWYYYEDRATLVGTMERNGSSANDIYWGERWQVGPDYVGRWAWYLRSRGPDMLWNWQSQLSMGQTGIEGWTRYDPSNGTVSHGDIIRIGP
jgi:hypothetical protein